MKSWIVGAWCCLAAALPLATQAQSALGDAGSSATLSGIVFSSTDLQPTDGIAPSYNGRISFSGTSRAVSGSSGTLRAARVLEPSEAFGSSSATALIDPSGITFVPGENTGGAQTLYAAGNAAASFKGGSLSVEAQGALAAYELLASIRTGVDIVGTVTVAPYTVFTVTALASVSTFLDGVACARTQCSAAASVQLALGGTEGVVSSSSLSLSTVEGVGERLRLFTLSFTNDSSASVELTLSGLVSSFAINEGVAAAVPEPATYALFLLGLALLTGLQRARSGRR